MDRIDRLAEAIECVRAGDYGVREGRHLRGLPGRGRAPSPPWTGALGHALSRR